MADLGVDFVAAVLAEAEHDAVVGDFGGIGDEGDDGIGKVVVYGVEDLGAEPAAEFLAFVVDFGVVGAGEVDALEGAFCGGALFGVAGDGEGSVAFDGGDVAGLELVDVFFFGIEDGHERGALGCEGDYFIGLVVGAGADSGGVAEDEGVSIADHAGNGVAAVPGFGGFADDLGEVELVGDGCGGIGAGASSVAEFVVEEIVGLVEVVADFFEDGLGIGAEDGVLTAGDEEVVELRCVGHVEVALYHEGLRGPIAAPDVGVAGV